MGENDYLALRGFHGQALRDALSAAMIERRHRIVEHNAALAGAQADFSQEGTDRHRTLLTLAQNVARTAALR